MFDLRLRKRNCDPELLLKKLNIVIKGKKPMKR